MSKRAVVVFAGAVLAISGAPFPIGCTSDSSPAIAAAIPSAEVTLVKRGSIAHTLRLAGQFQPYQVVDVHAKVSGYIRHIYVDIGDKVHAGQTLAVLEVPELNAQLKGAAAEELESKDKITVAEHEVNRAESDHYAVHADYERLQKAAATQPGLIAQQELDDAHAKDLTSQAEVDSAKAALSAATQGGEVANADHERVSALAAYTNVTAPLNGVIVWRYADTGALIQAGTSSDTQALSLVKLSQSDLLRLRLPVPEDAVPYIRIGAQVQVQVDAIHRSFTGTVVRYTRNLSLETRTMETEIDVPNRDLSIIPGMYANTTLRLEHRENVLTIPLQALIRSGNQTTVLVVDGHDRVQSKQVQVGIRGSTLAEITGGLSEGERVISGGQSKYQINEEVKPLLEATLNDDVTADEAGDSASNQPSEEDQ